MAFQWNNTGARQTLKVNNHVHNNPPTVAHQQQSIQHAQMQRTIEIQHAQMQQAQLAYALLQQQHATLLQQQQQMQRSMQHAQMQPQPQRQHMQQQPMAGMATYDDEGKEQKEGDSGADKHGAYHGGMAPIMANGAYHSNGATKIYCNRWGWEFKHSPKRTFKGIDAARQNELRPKMSTSETVKQSEHILSMANTKETDQGNSSDMDIE